MGPLVSTARVPQQPLGWGVSAQFGSDGQRLVEAFKRMIWMSMEAVISGSCGHYRNPKFNVNGNQARRPFSGNV